MLLAMVGFSGSFACASANFCRALRRSPRSRIRVADIVDHFRARPVDRRAPRGRRGPPVRSGAAGRRTPQVRARLRRRAAAFPPRGGNAVRRGRSSARDSAACRARDRRRIAAEQRVLDGEVAFGRHAADAAGRFGWRAEESPRPSPCRRTCLRTSSPRARQGTPSRQRRGEHAYNSPTRREWPALRGTHAGTGLSSPRADDRRQKVKGAFGGAGLSSLQPLIVRIYVQRLEGHS